MQCNQPQAWWVEQQGIDNTGASVLTLGACPLLTAARGGKAPAALLCLCRAERRPSYDYSLSRLVLPRTVLLSRDGLEDGCVNQRMFFVSFRQKVKKFFVSNSPFFFHAKDQSIY
jgi:hypothetical protein